MCEHIEIAKEILKWHDGKIESPTCGYCRLQNRLPLKFDLAGGVYILRYQFCHEVLWRE